MQTVDWRSCEAPGVDLDTVKEMVRLEQWAHSMQQYHRGELISIEIGSYYGRSTAILAQFGSVIAVDLFGHPTNGVLYPDMIGTDHYLEYIENIKRLGIIGRIFTIIGTSDVFKLITPSIKADIIFIDAAHHYSAVRSDILNLESHLAPHGMFIFDDYKRPGYGFEPFDKSKHDLWRGVSKAVDELIEMDQFEIQEHYRGIVNLRRKGVLNG